MPGEPAERGIFPMCRLSRFYPRIIIAAAILLLALFGGVQFYRAAPVLPVFLTMGVVLTWAALIQAYVHPPGVLAAGAVIYIQAMLLSALANPAILPFSLSRLTLAITAAAVLVLARRLDARALFDGLTLAGWLWPGTWLAAGWLGWGDNSNIMAIWSMLFIVAALAGRNWWFLVIHSVMLFSLTGRGAILGAGVAVLVMVWPALPARTNTKITVYSLAGIVALLGLIAWRPQSTLIRFYYWRMAVTAFIDSPLAGVGPGGLNALLIIPEPGSGFQIHAHNGIVSTAAEMGLVGLAALGLIAWLLYARRGSLVYYRWQMAALAGLLAHSLVDEPLWWPGPLLAAALIAGTTPNKK